MGPQARRCLQKKYFRQITLPYLNEARGEKSYYDKHGQMEIRQEYLLFYRTPVGRFFCDRKDSVSECGEFFRKVGNVTNVRDLSPVFWTW